MDTDRILSYLERCKKDKVYLGESHFSSKDAVKRAGGRWHADTKQWKATDEDSLLCLIDSGVWLPVGFTAKEALAVRAIIRQRDAVEAKRIHDQEVAARRKPDGPTEQQLLDTARRDLCVPDDDPKELEEVGKHGVTPEMVTDTARWAMLGPRSGISDVSRLLRGIRFGIVNYADIFSGKAARDMRGDVKKPKTTGEQGGRGKTGVKRGEQDSIGGAHKQKKQRVDVAPAKPCAPTPVRKVVEYRYTVTCRDCGRVVDSRLQFVECGCPGIVEWSRCNVCFLPMQQGNLCSGCADA